MALSTGLTFVIEKLFFWTEFTADLRQRFSSFFLQKKYRLKARICLLLILTGRT